MAELVTAAVSWLGTQVGGEIGAALVMNAVEIGAVTSTVGMLAGSSMLANGQKRRAERAAKEAYNASLQDRLLTIDTPLAARQLVLGRVRKAGAVFFKGSAGTYKEKFCMGLALAAHEIDAIETVYLNDVAVTLDADGYVTSDPYRLAKKQNGPFGLGSSTAVPVTALTTTLPNNPVDGSVSVVLTTGPDAGGNYTQQITPCTVSGRDVTITDAAFIGADIVYQWYTTSPKLRIRFYTGAAGQTADARLIELFPDLWTTAHTASGCAYAVVEADYDETAFPSGLPNLTVVMRGAKVYDPRTGLTAWSENPALLARHVYTHAFFGNKAVSSAADLRIIAAANACDTSTVYTVDGVPTTRALYTAGVTANYGAAAKDVLDDLVQAMAGEWCYAGGDFYMRAGVYTAPVLALTEADVGGQVRSIGGGLNRVAISGTAHRPRNEKFNVLNVTMADAAQDYKVVPMAPVKGSALITRDGGELAQPVQLSAVTYWPQAQHVAGVMMRDARDPGIYSIPFKLAAYRVQVLDTITLTISRYGWSAKEFRVLQRGWSVDGLIVLLLKETASTIWAVDAAFEPAGYAANTSLPSPWDLPVPQIAVSETLLLQPTTGQVATRLNVAITDLGDTRVTNNGLIELQYERVGDDQPGMLQALAGVSSLTIDNVADSAVYLIRARVRNATAVGDWCTQVAWRVVGKTARPADVSNLTVNPVSGQAYLSWDAATDEDVRNGGQLVVRFAPVTSGATWNTSTDLPGDVSGASTTHSFPLFAGTYLAKWRDSTGNDSVNAATAVTLAPGLLATTTVATVTEAPAFTGSKTNVSLDVDYPGVKIDSLGTFDSADLFDSSLMFDGGSGYQSSGTYTFASGVDLATTYTARVSGSVTVQVLDTTNLFDSSELFDSDEMFDGTVIDDVAAWLEVRTTTGDPTGSPTWSAWTRLGVADYSARAFQFRAQLTSTNSKHNVVITDATVTVGLADRLQDARNVASGAGTLSVTYPSRFYSTPGLQITPVGMGTGDYYTLASESATGFDITFKNAAGTSVDRTFHWLAKGP